MKTVVEFPSELILTLVPQGEVKVDLDEFDANLQKNFLCTAFVLEKPILVEMSRKSFRTSHRMSKK
jgi:hypothetical protein